MDTLLFTNMIDDDVLPDQPTFVQRIQKTWEDRNQFEEMVHALLATWQA